MNRLIFALLLALLGIGVLFPNLKIAFILALGKILLVLFFYMELKHAHAAWKVTSLGLIAATLFGLLMF
ncbi:MAG: hypothetical protein HUU57_14035 [Bdellovibrio sp.]|nr:hypothetical protein [Bdellovibrio sp.]